MDYIWVFAVSAQHLDKTQDIHLLHYVLFDRLLSDSVITFEPLQLGCNAEWQAKRGNERAAQQPL